MSGKSFGGAGKARDCLRTGDPFEAALQRAHRQRQQVASPTSRAPAWLVSRSLRAAVVGAENRSAMAVDFAAHALLGVGTQCAPDGRAIDAGPVGVGFALDGQVDAIDGLASAGVAKVSLVSSSRAVWVVMVWLSAGCKDFIASIVIAVGACGGAVMPFHMKSKHPRQAGQAAPAGIGRCGKGGARQAVAR